MKTLGDIACQGAVFIYKNDGTQDAAWKDADQINANHGGIRAEQHDNKTDFLASLTAWNQGVEPENAFLCIYAHMGKPGINFVGAVDVNLVTWAELAGALPCGVQYLWSVGCKSQECLTAWTPLAHPVKHLLLATSESKYWRPLLKCFAAEISINKIVLDGDMPAKIQEMEPGLAGLTEYYKPSANGFVKAFGN